jgi:menaquinone-dependent protoporphyrinogen oxidase
MPREDPPDGLAVHDVVDAAEHRVFGGRLDLAELGTAERLIVEVVRAPAGDFRPWPAVRAWADAIATALEGTRVPQEVAAGGAR